MEQEAISGDSLIEGVVGVPLQFEVSAPFARSLVTDRFSLLPNMTHLNCLLSILRVNLLYQIWLRIGKSVIAKSFKATLDIVMARYFCFVTFDNGFYEFESYRLHFVPAIFALCRHAVPTERTSLI